MNDALKYTVREMYRLAGDYAQDVGPELPASIGQIFNRVKAIPYVRDTDKLGDPAEVLKRPAITLRDGGDCDDKAILAGSYFNLMGLPWQLVTASFTPDGEMEHVYPVVYDPDTRRWIVFDATYPQNSLGATRPASSTILWRSPVRTTRLGVTTLEGYGSLGASPFDNQLTQATTPVPNQGAWETLFSSVLKSNGGPSVVTPGNLSAAGAVVGSVVPGVGTAAGGVIGGFLGMLGITIKGKTGHLSYDDANNLAKQFTGNVRTFVQSLPADARTFFLQQINIFYARFLADMGPWWGGAMSQLNSQWKAKGAFDTADGQLWFGLFIPAYTILSNADVTTVQQDWYQWYYLERYSPIVATPVATYLHDKLGEVVNAQSSGTFTVSSGAPGTSLVSSAFGASSGVLALLALGLVASRVGKKRRARRR